MFELGKIYWVEVKGHTKDRVKFRGKILEENEFMIKLERDDGKIEIILFNKILDINLDKNQDIEK